MAPTGAYIESYGYKCTMFTDTEVVAYLIDLLVRKHGLSEKMAVRALAPPFWDEIDRMPAKEQELNRAIRLTYGSALMNGPFAICVANEHSLVGFTDRIKLRPTRLRRTWRPALYRQRRSGDPPDRTASSGTSTCQRRASR